MDNLFQTRALTAAVNNIRPVRTPVLDRVFARKKGQFTDRLAWDVKASAERLLSNLRVAAPATVRDQTTFKTVTTTAPRFAQKRLIPAADLNAARQYGSQAGAEMLAARIADELFDMRADIDRTREFMAVKCLTGTVVDEAGVTLVNYGFAGAQTPTLTGTDVWTDAASDPVKNLRAWKKLIADEHPVDGFVAFCGSAAMDALLNNSKVLELLKYTSGSQVAESGRIARLAEVDIVEYFGTYKDAAGARQQLFGADKFALVGTGPDVSAELYAPVVDLEAADGVGTGAPAGVFFAKAWEDKDPSGRWLKVESRPLPVLYRPGCVVFADVL